MLQDLKWDTLKDRRSKARLTIIYKETHGLIPSNISALLQSPNPDNYKYQTRQRGALKYQVLRSNKDCYRHSLYPKTIPEWNLLSEDIRNSKDVTAFKLKLESLQVDTLVTKAHYQN